MTDTTILLNDFRQLWSDIRGVALESFDRVGKSGWLVLGQEVQSFEEALAKFWGLEHAVGVASGLDALEIALRVAGLKPGEVVVTTPLSAFATTLAILRAGGVPTFVDVDASGLIDLEKARALFKSHRDWKFFLPVHLYGFAIHAQSLESLKNEFDLVVIEDCAQSIAAKSAGQPTGAVGVFAATSFYPTKNLGCFGDGGAILTRNADEAKKCKVMRDYGQSAKYVHTELGLNSRLDELQAALMKSALLPKLDQWTQIRRRIAGRYLSEINHPNLKVIHPPKGSEPSWHLFPVLVLKYRDQFQEYLKSHRILSGVHYPILIPDQKALERFSLGKTKDSLENAKRFSLKEVSLPIHPFLTELEVDRVIQVCNAWSPS